MQFDEKSSFQKKSLIVTAVDVLPLQSDQLAPPAGLFAPQQMTTTRELMGFDLDERSIERYVFLVGDVPLVHVLLRPHGSAFSNERRTIRLVNRVVENQTLPFGLQRQFFARFLLTKKTLVADTAFPGDRDEAFSLLEVGDGCSHCF